MGGRGETGGAGAEGSGGDEVGAVGGARVDRVQEIPGASPVSSTSAQTDYPSMCRFNVICLLNSSAALVWDNAEQCQNVTCHGCQPFRHRDFSRFKHFNHT